MSGKAARPHRKAFQVTECSDVLQSAVFAFVSGKKQSYLTLYQIMHQTVDMKI